MRCKETPFLSSPIILKEKTRRSVLEVLERANDTFVGTFQFVPHKDFGFVVIDKKTNQ